MTRYAIALLLLGIAAGAGGCAATTETGYKPRALSDTRDVQRGYYAPQYSKEAMEAQSKRGSGFSSGSTPLGPRP